MNQRWPKVNNPWDVSNVSQLRGKRWERAMQFCGKGGVENYVKFTQCRRHALHGKHRGWESSVPGAPEPQRCKEFSELTRS